MTHPTLNQVKDFAAKLAASAKLQSIDSKALYTYEDETGAPLYWRVRADCRATGEKFIRPFYWTGTAFESKEPPAPLEGKPLYGLQRLAIKPAAVVIVCEGEKATDALNRYFHLNGCAGVLAVTSGGASSAGAANWQPLNGRACFVFPDHDEAGAKYAHEVIAALQGIASSAAVLDISGLGLPPKGDAVEWLAAGGNLDGLMMIDATRSPPAAIDETPEAVTPHKVAAMVTPEAAPVEVLEVIESEDEVITRCANLNPLAYDRIKKATAELLGVSTGALDKAVRLAQKDLGDDESATPFDDVEPHPHPIDPAALLSEISDTVRRFIILEREQADICALWVAFTHFVEVVHVAPLLIITAPEAACGKSQLRDLLARMVARPLNTNNMKAATLFRIAEKWHPSLMLDEVDLMLKSDDDLSNLINAGHHRGASQVWRLVGDNHEPKAFDVYGAKCFAGIALENIFQPSTLSRSFIIKLRKKTTGETIEKIRHAPAGLFEEIAAKLARFCEDYSEAVSMALPAIPEALTDRDGDNLETLLAIASCAGDAWLERATNAALKLYDAAIPAQSIGNELLADIQHIFEAKRLDKISTADLIAALCEDEELSWATYNRGKPLSPRQLSKRLGDYGISSKTIRINAYDTPKGFSKEQFLEAFSRYLSDPLKNAVLSATPPQVNNDGLKGVAAYPPQNAIRHTSATPFAPPLQGCGGVAAKNGESEKNGKSDFVEFAL